MSGEVLHLKPTDSGITAIMEYDLNSMIGYGIILDHATRTVLFRNGDGSEALIPADLLPEDLTTARGDLDALRVVKHLVERVRKSEAEQKDLWQYIKRGKMLAEAERRADMCRNDNVPCPEIWGTCPSCDCSEVTPEHWLEILRKEAEQE